MKQATLKVAGTAALGIAIAATAAGAASAAANGGLSALPTGALPDTGGLTGTLSKAPALGGPVTQATGALSPSAGTPAAPAADAPVSASGEATRGLPIGQLSGVAQKAPGPVGGLLGGAAPVSGALPGLG